MAKTTKSNRASGGTATIHDQKPDRGEGGELHQTASGKVSVLTTAQGGPVSDDQNALKIGPRGSTLIEDFHFREKIFHFDHERIPERVVHARGYAARSTWLSPDRCGSEAAVCARPRKTFSERLARSANAVAAVRKPAAAANPRPVKACAI
jgi:hypothetical protein